MSDLIWSIGYDYKLTTINTSPPITDDDATPVMISHSARNRNTNFDKYKAK